MEYPPLTQRLLLAVDKFPSPRAQMFRAENGWQEISSAELLRRVARLSAALDRLGIVSGDRVGVFSPNRPEWHVADFAILGLGAVNVPIYFNESPDRMVYILNHSEAKAVFVAGAEQTRRLLGIRDRVPTVQHVICLDAAQDAGPDPLRYEAIVDPAAGTAPDGAAEIAAYRRRAELNVPEQLATLIYTSGTTGEPKGVMLTHNNLSSNVTDGFFGTNFDYRTDQGLSFLPLSHVYERVMGYAYLFNGVPVAYVPDMNDVSRALLEVRPTIVAAVPRFFEKVYARIVEQGRACPRIKRAIFDRALRVARQAVPWKAYGARPSALLRFKWRVADRLVFHKIRAATGGRFRLVSCGSAPLAKDLIEFFWAVGIKIYQGYGLTEASPIISTNIPAKNRTGSVGPIIPHVEVRIAADGEIEARGPCVMRGYYQRPEDTRAAISPDGWLSTGDIGRLDEDGFLYVTDRKKELLKTAGGKFVAPQMVENLLKASPYISSVAVVGDRRRFVAALIVPNFESLEKLARERKLPVGSHEETAAAPWVREEIEREVNRLCAPLAHYESVKRFALLPDDFTFERGELTYTMKLKRRVIEQKYAAQIERIYADAEQHSTVTD
ncbi:MAG: long-chain fatty acid--CoA ligase [Candidatus Acidiferrales bacterium]